MSKKYYYLLILTLSLVGCSKTLLIPSNENVSALTLETSNTSVEDLKDGQKLYIIKCGNCHYLYRPARFSEEKWKHEMPEMAVKAKISTTDQNQILKYLLVMREVELAKQKID